MRRRISKVFLPESAVGEQKVPVLGTEPPIPKPDGRPADMSKPVQVFILLGQSNMIGAGRIDAGDKGKPAVSHVTVRNSIVPVGSPFAFSDLAFETSQRQP